MLGLEPADLSFQTLEVFHVQEGMEGPLTSLYSCMYPHHFDMLTGDPVLRSKIQETLN
jgi:hypothetical protein